MAAQSQYDPTSSQPYAPPVLPDITPATPPPDPNKQQAQPYQFNGGPISAAGAIAGVADNIFRGVMQGKAKAQAQQAFKIKRQTDNMQAAYNASAQNLKAMHDSGVDPNSDEYKNAKAAVDGSWAGLMQFYGQHVDQGDKKKKGGKGQQQQQGTIIERLHSKDPAEVMKAWYEVMQRAGPPVYYQLGDPKAAQQKKQIDQLHLDNELSAEQKQKTINDIQAIPQDKRTAVQQAQLLELTTKPVVPKEPTNAYEGALAAFEREHGRKPNVEENAKLEQGVRPEAKDPNSPFAMAASAKKKELGRDLTEKEVLQVYTETKTADPFAGMRAEIAASRLDDAKQRKVDSIVNQGDNATIRHKTQIQKRIDDLEKETIGNASSPAKLTKDSQQYKDRMAAIERDDYAGMIGIGKIQKQRLGEFGVKVEAPKPEPWTTSLLSDDERKKILGDQKKAEASVETTTAAPAKKAAPAVHPSQLPKEAVAQLQEGYVTTFANGQAWTLQGGKPLQVDENGKPIQVQ